ncbi:MAG: cytochrome c oxidase, subunit [Solirubrobacterales bacterium]|nr:cytochrome c oxidase, subunit [Solirubrobacterales bacterium]
MNRIPPALRPNRLTSPRRRLALAAVAVGVLSLLLTSTASADFFTPESGGSPNADKIDTLYKLILGVAVVVFVGVEGALFYCLWKFKAKKGAVAAQIHGNTRLEIGWTVGAAVILVVLAGFTFAALPGIRNPENSGPNGFQSANGVLTAGVTKRLPPNGKSLNIDVNGQQYVWRYTYPDGDTNTLNNVFAYEEMVVPVDTTVTLDIRAQDVAHSWWIPKLGGKFDAIPGYTNHTWFKIPAKLAGQTFRGQCAELCGRNHANMIASVKAVTPQEFEKFLADQKANTEAADKAAAAARKAFEKTLTTDQAPTP